MLGKVIERLFRSSSEVFAEMLKTLLEVYPLVVSDFRANREPTAPLIRPPRHAVAPLLLVVDEVPAPTFASTIHPFDREDVARLAKCIPSQREELANSETAQRSIIAADDEKNRQTFHSPPRAVCNFLRSENGFIGNSDNPCTITLVDSFISRHWSIVSLCQTRHAVASQQYAECRLPTVRLQFLAIRRSSTWLDMARRATIQPVVQTRAPLRAPLEVRRRSAILV